MSLQRVLLGTSLAAAVAGGAGCGDDDDDGPTRFTVQVANRAPSRVGLSAGQFEVPQGAEGPRPIGPGETYEFEVRAPPGAHLSIATMLIPSNDLFVASSPEGIPLFVPTTGQPLSGEIRDELLIWDAGTEANEELGLGSNQANDQDGVGQGAPNLGPRDADATVRAASVDALAPIDALISLTVRPDTNDPGAVTVFTVELTNLSDESSLDLGMGQARNVLFSPGAFVVHAPNQPAPLFQPGQEDLGLGLESLAEDGNPTALLTSLSDTLGPTIFLSPGAFAVFESQNPILNVDAPASEGLERIAEDGMPETLANALAAASGALPSGAFSVPEGATEPGPIGPGQAYAFTFDALPPARLSFATMYIDSNDVVLATGPGGVALFSGDTPFNGQVASTELDLFDAGTEANEEPGFGPNQAPRQSRPDTGTPESENVRPVVDTGDGFSYLSPAELVEVTVTAAPTD